MNTLINNFKTVDNKAVAEAVKKLIGAPAQQAKDFRLTVVTPDDQLPEGKGQYAVEAHVVLGLIDTAYAEIVSWANRTPRTDSIPVAERGRHLSGMDDQYDGADSDAPKPLTERDIAEELNTAIYCAASVKRYAEHIAAIKDGGAQWLAGFDVDAWVATDEKDEATVEMLKKPGTDISKLITEGKIKRVKTHSDSRLVSFNAWCDKQLALEYPSVEWKAKIAMARVQNIVLPNVDVNTACNFIGDWASKSAFGRDTSRLEDAAKRVANRKYLSLAYAIESGVKKDITKAMKAWAIIPYSEMLADDVKALKTSDEWADHQLELAVSDAKKKLADERRAMAREMFMVGIEQQAAEMQIERQKMEADKKELEAKRAAIFAMLNPDVAKKAEEEAKAKAEKKAAAQAKAAATRAAKKAAQATRGTSAAAGTTKGIAGKRSAFDHLQ